MSRTRQVNFRCPEHLYELFEHAARAANVSMTTWFLVIGVEATGHSELRKHLERVARAPKPTKKGAGRRKAVRH